MAAQSTKPRIAVLEFKNKADNQYWWHGGAEAAQDVFVTELDYRHLNGRGHLGG